MEVEPFLQSAEHRQRVRRELGYGPEHVVIGKIARLFKPQGPRRRDSGGRPQRSMRPVAAGWQPAPQRAASGGLEARPTARGGLEARPTAASNVRFLFVGDGVLRGRLERQIAAAGLSDYFQFTGLVPPERIPELIAAMDVVVHASLREGPCPRAAAGVDVRQAGRKLRHRRCPRGGDYRRDRLLGSAVHTWSSLPPDSASLRPIPPSATGWAPKAGGGSPTSSATNR